jgi:hypothetical protein
MGILWSGKRRGSAGVVASYHDHSRERKPPRPEFHQVLVAADPPDLVAAKQSP